MLLLLLLLRSERGDVEDKSVGREEEEYVDEWVNAEFLWLDAVSSGRELLWKKGDNGVDDDDDDKEEKEDGEDEEEEEEEDGEEEEGETAEKGEE